MLDFKSSQNQQFTSDGICFIHLATVWTWVGNPRPSSSVILVSGNVMFPGNVMGATEKSASPATTT